MSTLRVAVVGSGPAGFYAADYLLEAGAQVDVLERLPTPWGLVRLGVAPDHPELKTASRMFEKTAAKDGFRFFGNVEGGKDVAADELLRLYDGGVYTVGAQTDRRLGIPGEELPGSWAATEFVAWYNGHPDYQHLEFDLSSERAVVIGNGNVAIDVARILPRTEDELAPTDITEQSTAAIVAPPITDIVMLGRRGAVQAAFTPPWLKELGELGGADVVVDAADLVPDAASAASLESAGARTKRNLDILREFAARSGNGKPKQLALRFCVSPVQVLGEGKVEAIQLVRNALVTNYDGEIKAVPTEEVDVIPCGLVLRCVGYRGVGLPGVPFDERPGVTASEEGGVTGRPGVCGEGWIKRGPGGVRGKKKKAAAEPCNRLLEDASAGRLECTGGQLEELLRERGVDFVEYAGWQAIDEHERSLGEPVGRPRVKLTSWDELLARARELDSGA